MRTIKTDEIIHTIKEMCIEANHYLTEDMEQALNHATETEKAPLGKQILCQLRDNLRIASEDMIPICQDTGMAVFFIEVGQDVHVEGGLLTDAVNEGVRQGYVDGFLRKSVVKDPILRENTKDNTPAVIHYDIVAGDKIRITIAPKGFGSENMSRVFMLKPADGIEGVKDVILTAVNDIQRIANASVSQHGRLHYALVEKIFLNQRCRSECLSSDGSRSRSGGDL